jgi:hypothetical protein
VEMLSSFCSFVRYVCFVYGLEVENRQETLRIGDPAGVGLKLLGYGSTVPTKFEQRKRGTDKEAGVAWNCFFLNRGKRKCRRSSCGNRSERIGNPQ